MGAGVKEINLGIQLLPLWDAPCPEDAVEMLAETLGVRRTILPFRTVKLEGMDSGLEGGVRV